MIRSIGLIARLEVRADIYDKPAYDYLEAPSS